MADILAIFGILLLVGITYPGLLTLVWLLFTQRVERTAYQVEAHPRRSFWLGLALTGLTALGALIFLSSPSGALQFVGWLGILLVLAFSVFGAAGLAQVAGARLARRSAGRYSPAGAFVRGALLLELAVIFPLVGWLVVLPFSLLVALGASGLALFSRVPQPQPAPAPAGLEPLHEAAA